MANNKDRGLESCKRSDDQLTAALKCYCFDRLNREGRADAVRAVILMLTKLTFVLAGCPVGATAEPDDAVKRTQMIRTIEAHVQEMSSSIGRDHIDARILEVIGTIPRHAFVRVELREAS